MAVTDLITPCSSSDQTKKNSSITPESKQQPLLNEKNPIISSKRLNHSGYNCEESSFRIYYGANNGDISIPFKWESHPGTPKHNSDHRCGQSKSNQPSPTSSKTTNKNTIRTPLTPPPSYQLKNPTTTTINSAGSSPWLSSKININYFLSTALPRRFILLKNSSSSTATTGNSVDPSSHSRSSSSSSPRTSLSSLWASESSDPSHSQRTTPTPLVRRSKTRTCVNEMDQTTGNNKQQVNKKRSSTVDEEPQCSTTCFGTPTSGTAATNYASTGDSSSNGGGYSSPMRSTVKNAILSVVSCRVMRSSNHHVDYIV